MSLADDATAYCNIIFPYQHAHKSFVHSSERAWGLPEDMPMAIHEAYAYCVLNVNELARFKMYDDSFAFVMEEMKTATGDRLHALYLWTWLVQMFWDKMLETATCQTHTGSWNVVKAQHARIQATYYLDETSPWMRKGKNETKLKKPVLFETSPDRQESYS